MSVQVKSEIGHLRKVLLHRPANELLNLIPQYLHSQLFDDIPYLEVAQAEHDNFAKLLTSKGVEVVYYTDLIAQSIINNDIKKLIIHKFLTEANLHSQYIFDQLYEYLFNLDNRELASVMISGIRKNNLNLNSNKHITDLLKCDYPLILDPMPNMYFARDPFSFVGNGVIISKMFMDARKRETLWAEFIFNYHPIYKNIPKYYCRDDNYPIEGGDILVLNSSTLAIGISQRTSAYAIEKLASTILNSDSGFKSILAFDIPKQRSFMHLDTVFTMLNTNTFSIHSEILNNLTVIQLKLIDNKLTITKLEGSLPDILKKVLDLDSVKLLSCGGADEIDSVREQWSDGANTFAIKPNEVVVYRRNTVSNKHLVDAGIIIHEIACSELSRGRGGPRCMTMPIFRD